MTRWPIAVVLALLAGACAEPPAPPPPRVAVTRALGAWEGRGNQTLGFTSESGRLRVTWRTTNAGPQDGSFRLTLHSAVSGRPLDVLADHRGNGGATAHIDEDPRPFNLMVESTNLEWTIRVEEIVAGAAPR